MLPNYQQIWVKKTLLKAQGDSTYKWVTKQLLNQATLPAMPPANKKKGSPQETWPKRQIKEKWIPTEVLTKQGYYKGASYLWLPKHKAGQAVPKQLKISNDHQPSYGQTQLKWVPKAQEGKSTTRNKGNKSLNNQTS